MIGQAQFFARFVRPYLERKNKVCVLISDAFRYEVGEELQSLIRREDRFGGGTGAHTGLFAELHPVGHGSPAAAHDLGAGRKWKWRGPRG